MKSPIFAWAAAILCAVSVPPARAATVDLQVRGGDGQPLAGAVVMLTAAKAPSGPIRFPWPYVVAQQNISFQPHVLIVPVGASVSFPNLDKVRHHVYSFSKTKKFELKLYGHEEQRTVTFDKPGIVAIGCNIHDRMSGYIVVVDTPFAAQTDAQGHAKLAAVPPGGATVAIWHPSIRGRDNSMSQPVSIPPGGLATTLTVNR